MLCVFACSEVDDSGSVSSTQVRHDAEKPNGDAGFGAGMAPDVASSPTASLPSTRVFFFEDPLHWLVPAETPHELLSRAKLAAGSAIHVPVQALPGETSSVVELSVMRAVGHGFTTYEVLVKVYRESQPSKTISVKPLWESWSGFPRASEAEGFPFVWEQDGVVSKVMSRDTDFEEVVAWLEGGALVTWQVPDD